MFTTQHNSAFIKFYRYERLLDEYSLDVIPGMVFCPRPKCNARVASDPQDRVAVCSNCQYPFCKLCRQLWHGDTTVCPATVQVMQQCVVVEGNVAILADGR